MIDNGWIYGYNPHYIIDTDYDNYALVYGCDWYVMPGIWVEYATLLSREPYLEYPYVRAAKDFLNEVGYAYDAYWMKPGIECGFDAAKTLDEVMVE